MNGEEIKFYKKAGLIASRARDYAANLIKEGVLVSEIADKTEEYILNLGGKIAFPAQFSINDIAAHFCPQKDDLTALKEGDLVCIDVGAHVEGFIGDTARTVIVGKETEKLKNIKQASLDALNKVIDYLKNNKKPVLSEIGKEINMAITKRGLNPIRNLSGHGLEQYEVHSYPQIPNYDNKNQEILEDQAFAIEPFATNGVGLIEEKGIPNVFMQISNKNARGLFTRKILKKINTYDGLPFARRWLQKEFRDSIINYGLNELKLIDAIQEFQPLVEKSNGFVSQHEHSFVITDGKLIITTDRED